MKKDFPLTSQEIYDRLMLMYEHLVNILGTEVLDNGVYSGIYHELEASGNIFLLGGQSGVAPIPIIQNNSRSIGISNLQNFDEYIPYLKFDWIYRKDKGFIK